jgi:hypothetical protein
MFNCVVESGEYWRCSLCSYKLALTAAQPGGPKQQPDPSVVARHVAVVHNYIGHAYTSRVPAAPRTSYEPYRYSCELCPSFVTVQLAALLSHLAQCHVHQHFTPEMRACPTCRLQFPHVDDLIKHICSDREADCNLALFFYYSEVDRRLGVQHVRRSWPEYLQRLRNKCRATAAAAAESQQPPLPALQIYPAAFGLREAAEDFVEDPLSSPLRLQYNFYEESVSVEFKKNLPMKSFRPQALSHSRSWGAGKSLEGNICFFCKLLDKPFPPACESSGDFREATDRLLIHLAEEHFANQLERMLANPHREGFFRNGIATSYRILSKYIMFSKV